MTTGHDITTRIINRVIIEHDELYIKVERPLVIHLKDGIETFERNRGMAVIPKDVLKAIEKWRDYINKNYLFVELDSTQVEDIFRHLFTEDYQKLCNNNEDSEIWYKITEELIKKIEEITNCPGLFIKIFDKKV